MSQMQCTHLRQTQARKAHRVPLQVPLPMLQVFAWFSGRRKISTALRQQSPCGTEEDGSSCCGSGEAHQSGIEEIVRVPEL